MNMYSVGYWSKGVIQRHTYHWLHHSWCRLPVSFWYEYCWLLWSFVLHFVAEIFYFFVAWFLHWIPVTARNEKDVCPSTFTCCSVYSV